MKKILALLLVAVMLMVSACGNVETTGGQPTATPGATATSAPSADSISVTVRVNGADGSFAIANVAIDVTDVDQDGKYTIADALYCAHASQYKGDGLGFATADTEYGLSLTMLWGDTSGAFGYYLNNVSSMSLSDEVKEGDLVVAYIYRDQVMWSDSYTSFDVNYSSVAVGETVTLTLNGQCYDANFNVVTAPISGAVITVNGQTTEYVTGEDGTVTVSFDASGTYSVALETEGNYYVAALCIIEVK